ncbi:MAG: aspartate-alanine antiporter [Bacteroidales bacterium]|nr:aspartate-alanine antiporter [Bacteroidales bacterium]
MDQFCEILREYPALALFLTLGAGFLVGRIKIGIVPIGSVTSVLVIGVLVGQLHVTIDGPIKTFFFMLFLFSIGYSVGPDFFRSLKGTGAKQALFAVCMSSMCFVIVVLVAKFMGYTKGESVGLFSGSETCSALLGIGGEAIQRLPISKEEIQDQLNIIPVCYAVTYVYGTLGTVILLGNFGPKLLGGIKKVREKTFELERKLDNSGKSTDPACQNAYNQVSYRAFHVTSHFFDTPRTVNEAEIYLDGKLRHVYIDRIRHGDDVFVPNFDNLIYKGDHIVICGRRDYMVGIGKKVGPEVADDVLLSYTIERLKVTLTRKKANGLTIGQLRQKPRMHGVVIHDAVRLGQPLPVENDTPLQKGDVLTVIARPGRIKVATADIGHIDRPSVSSDLMFVGFAIAIGGLFGVLSFTIDQVPISLGTSGGALVGGLVFGWLRSKRPTFGHIPRGALWLMNNLGLNVFIAVVGINAGPSFVEGIKSVGWLLLVAGIVTTTVPLLFGLWLGQKVFKFNPAITLGCCAGTRTCTASLGAVQNALGSTLPAIGYTVTYAVSNILLVVWGMLAVLLI